MKNVCVCGIGGVGGYFGGKLAANSSDRNVYFVARGEHLEHIKRDGLTLKTPAGTIVSRPAIATDAPEELPLCDILIVSVKSYSLPEILPRLGGVIGERTCILPLLNGVDIPERIRAVTGKGVILPACVYVGTHIESPGVVTQNGGDGKILFGPGPGMDGFDPSPITAMFDNAGILCEYHTDPHPPIWMKYIFISAYGMVTAAYGKTLDEVYADTAMRDSVMEIMSEIETIARKRGVNLPHGAAEQSLDKAAKFPPGTKTSFQRDIERGGHNEGDLFGGTIIRMGREMGIPVPAAEKFYTLRP
ncbi:MAG: 2-dehydropantoate 2-reductase [Brevinematales bacterium]|nr:2-dehydropantoate 2-reductase [Brevinematales bacterium]